MFTFALFRTLKKTVREVELVIARWRSSLVMEAPRRCNTYLLTQNARNLAPWPRRRLCGFRLRALDSAGEGR